jgi:hypothetical protein
MPNQSRRDPTRADRVRGRWWSQIETLQEPEAKAALLQLLIDLDEHWEKEHPEDGLPEDLGIPPDEYLATLIERIREAPPSETRRPSV